MKRRVTTMTRQFGISILSAGKLTGSITNLFKSGGVLKAAMAAHNLGLGVQLLPIATTGISSSKGFASFLQALRNENVSVISYENRWGANNMLHPWVKDLPDGKFAAVLAYYLLFPWRYRDVQFRTELLKLMFPSAIPIDLPEGPLEIDLHKWSADFWQTWLTSEEAKRRGVVVDTFHLLEFEKNVISNILHLIQVHTVPVRVLHLQFRDKSTCLRFLLSEESTTKMLLKEIKSKKIASAEVPVVIELVPELVSKEILLQLQMETTEVLAY
jgi:hypothetical protein